MRARARVRARARAGVRARGRATVRAGDEGNGTDGMRKRARTRARAPAKMRARAMVTAMVTARVRTRARARGGGGRMPRNAWDGSQVGGEHVLLNSDDHAKFLLKHKRSPADYRIAHSPEKSAPEWRPTDSAIGTGRRVATNPKPNPNAAIGTGRRVTDLGRQALCLFPGRVAVAVAVELG